MATPQEVAAILPNKSQADYERIAYQVNTGIRTWADVELWARHLAAGTQPSSAELALVGTTNTAVYGSVPTGGQDLNSVPEGDQAQTWRDTSTGKYYLVFYVPGTQIPLMYEATEAEIQSMVGPDQPIRVHRYGTLAAFHSIGGLDAGKISTGELNNPTKNPFDAWESAYADQAKVSPWLLDPEMVSLSAEALLEGRPVSEAEWQGTRWWQTHTAAERQWLVATNADPATARQLFTSNQIGIANNMRAAGLDENSTAAEYIARMFTTGKWDADYVANQIKALSDPYSGLAVDPDFQTAALSGGPIGQTQAQVQKVKDLVDRWVGPAFGNWSESEVAAWAGKLRNDPDGGELELTEMLQAQRVALFPEYENPNLSYQDIAAPWKQVFREEWGAAPDERSPLFNQVIRSNDRAKAGQLLRAEGLKQGNKTVLDRARSALGQATPQIRRAL